MVKTVIDIWNASLIKVYQVKDLTQDSFFGTIWGYLITLIHGDNGVLSVEAKSTVDPLLKTITWFAGLTMLVYRIIAIHKKNQKINAETESQKIDNQIKLEEHNAKLEMQKIELEQFGKLITEIREHQKNGDEDLIEEKIEKMTKATNFEHNLRIDLERKKKGL